MFLGLNGREDLAKSAFFLQTASNYMVQIVRESLSGHAGKDSGAALLACTAFASALVARLMSSTSRGKLSEAVRVYYLLLFWAMLLLVLAFSLQASTLAARFFFILSHMATILTSSFLWGLMSSSELRMRSHLAAFSKAATFGQAFGSMISWILVKLFDRAEIQTPLLGACILCGLATICVRQLSILGESGRQVEAGNQKNSNLVASDHYAYLGLLALFQLLNCMSSALVYLAKLDAVSTMPAAEISRFSSRLNFLSAGFIILVQISGIPEWLPIGTSLLMLPVCTGCGVIAQKFWFASSNLSALALLIIVSGVTSYAITKASREALFGVLDDQTRLRMKPMFDGVICKVGTVLASGFHLIKFDVFTHVFVFVFWAAIILALGHQGEKLAQSQKLH